MSQVGLKPVLAALPTAKDEPPRQSGRYAIDPQRREARDVSPPMAADPRPDIAQLLEINRLSQEELDWIAARRARAATRAPIVFAKDGEELTPENALTPFYREPALERVQLQFEDRSLDPSANPLALSSLLPPPRTPVAMFPRVLAFGAASLAVLSVGYLAAVATFGGAERASPRELAAREALVVRLAAPASEISTAPRTPAAGVDEVPWSIASSHSTEDSDAVTGPASKPMAPAVSTAPASSARLAARAQPRTRPRAVAARVGARAVAAAAQPAALPAQPSRDEIKAVIERARPTLQACAGDQHGTFRAHINITGTGRVASATIEGAFAGSPQGSCMARGLRGVVFPRFSNPTLQVTYPFRM